MLEDLLHASDSELLSILIEADNQDEVAPKRRLQTILSGKTIPNSSLEIVILGSLGCRLGMLRGGAGGFLLNVAGVDLLVDPGPAALSALSKLEKRGLFRFGNLDAILCSHIHTDHITDLLPCIEGMTGGMQVRRGYVIGNQTVIEKFTAFSSYHLEKTHAVALAPHVENGGLPISVELDGVTVWATPTIHREEKGKQDTGIGFLVQSQNSSIWYTSDTNLFDGLLQHVNGITGGQRLTLVIANADASDINRKPGKAEICHLLTRDVPEIAKGVKPCYILIQHYDEAYSSPRYRIAQAIYLQRLVNQLGLDTVILPSANGLRLSFDENHLKEHEMYFESKAGIVVNEYIERQVGGQHA